MSPGSHLLTLASVLITACIPGLSDPEAYRAARGGGSSADGGATENAATQCDEAAVLDLFEGENCASSICHSAGGTPPDLSMLTPTPLAQRLLDVSAQGAMGCDPEMAYVSSDGADHYLLDKLQASPTCGDPMPFGTSMLDEDQLDCIRSWIDAIAEDAQ